MRFNTFSRLTQSIGDLHELWLEGDDNGYFYQCLDDVVQLNALMFWLCSSNKSKETASAYIFIRPLCLDIISSGKNQKRHASFFESITNLVFPPPPPTTMTTTTIKHPQKDTRYSKHAHNTKCPALSLSMHRSDCFHCVT